MTSWRNVELVFVFTPTCPHCGSGDYITTRSDQNGDNTVTRKAICRDCSKPFKIVAEPLPKNGELKVSIKRMNAS